MQPVTYPVLGRTRDDDPAFADSVERVVAGHVFRYRPELVCLVRIERWFDHRWLGFSGKGRVHFDGPSPRHAGVALAAHRQDQLTFPPFVPTRVASEDHWHRRGDGDYARAEGQFRVHRPQRQHSSANLHRRVADLSDAALFVWFSSTSARDRRGSMLVYVVHDGVTVPWFAGLSAGSAGWRLADVHGLGRLEVSELLEHPPLLR